MDWPTWLQWMLTTLQIVDASGAAAFQNIAAMIIAIAEGRLYRDQELDFLASRDVDISKTTANGTRAVAIPANLIVVEGVSLVTPANTKPSAAGAQRVPLLRTTRAFLDQTWPVEASVAAPDPLNGGYFALYSQQQASPAPGAADEPTPLPSAILIAPTPDNSYIVEFTGTFRPAPLSATNKSTFLTTYLPDLFFCASMVAAAGYQRDYGRQADDPQLAMSWERLFQQLRQGAALEEWRKKALVEGYSSLPPARPTPLPQLAAQAQQLPAG